MTTGAELAIFSDKRMLGSTDFDARLLRYLQTQNREAIAKLFVQGAFNEAMPLTAAGASKIQVGLKPSAGDGLAHDGAGRLLDLAKLSDRTAQFENVNSTVYQVGACYVEYPKEIRINPRTSKPEYDRYVEGIGEQATPDSVTVGSSTITFRVDSLFEKGVAVGNHAGRQVRVFRSVPGDVALTESVAIETRTVFFGGGQNQITTTGLLGQSNPSSAPTDYYVQLVGLTVLKSTSTNAPSNRPNAAFFIGTVTGNGGTPVTFNTASQTIVKSQAATQITADLPVPSTWADSTSVAAGTVQSLFNQLMSALTTTSGIYRAAGKLTMGALGNWADGVTNPATSIGAALAKIVSDLTSTTDVKRGAGKITAAALGNWSDGTTNPAASVQDMLAKIVTDLTSTNGLYGAGKISIPARNTWADGVANVATNVYSALNKIITDLTSVTDPKRGAGKITAAALTPWADGITNPATTLQDALAKVVSDLTSTTDATRGAGKITSPLLSGSPASLAAASVATQLGSLLAAVNAATIAAEQRSEIQCVMSLRTIWSDTSNSVNGALTSIAVQYNNNGVGFLRALAVGPFNANWLWVYGSSGQALNGLYLGTNTGNYNDVAWGHAGFIIAGNSNTVNGPGRIYRVGVGLSSLGLAKEIGANTIFNAVEYRATGPGSGIYIVVGSECWTSTDGTNWNAGAMFAGGARGVAISPGGVVVAVSTDKVYSSINNGASWQLCFTVSPGASAPTFVLRQVRFVQNQGFFALYKRADNTFGVVFSADGLTNWAEYNAPASGLYGLRPLIAALDRHLVFFDQDSQQTTYALMNATPDAPTPANSSINVPLSAVISSPAYALASNGDLWLVGADSNNKGVVCYAPRLARPSSRSI